VRTRGRQRAARADQVPHAVVARLLARGAELVGEVESYEDNYRLYYPEGTIIELPEQIGLKAQAAAEGTTQRPRLHRQQIVEPLQNRADATSRNRSQRAR
jgi:hypothetical protein